LIVNVALLSGHTEVLEVEQSSGVQELKVLAQNSCERRFLKLVTAEGRPVVHLGESLQAEGIQDGNFITAIPPFRFKRSWQQMTEPLPCGVMEATTL